MDVMTPGTQDVDSDAGDAGAAHGRWARHLVNRRQFRRRLAIGLAAAGVIAIIVGLSWHPGKGDAGTTKPEPVTVNDVTENTAKPASTGPGGVGANPEKTGLPAVKPGGRVRTGTKEEGCFATMREYQDAWDRTGQEPDPCFLPQEPANQPQPDGVVRSYNGEKF
jgi:hypothetical protein